jgi:hypothetical protein
MPWGVGGPAAPMSHLTKMCPPAANDGGNLVGWFWPPYFAVTARKCWFSSEAPQISQWTLILAPPSLRFHAFYFCLCCALQARNLRGCFALPMPHEKYQRSTLCKAVIVSDQEPPVEDVASSSPDTGPPTWTWGLLRPTSNLFLGSHASRDVRSLASAERS